MGLRITPLRAGTLMGLPQPAVTYNFGWGKTHDAALIMFLIEGGKAPILVDTGSGTPEHAARWHNYRLERTATEEPRIVLRDAGVDPSTIATVIFTHLHWDHSSNLELFPNARFFMQQTELTYALHPLDLHRAAYERLDGIRAPWMDVVDRLVPLDGEAEITEDISVVPLPGHTPGSQGVCVRTEGGRYILAGDCVDTYENWHGNGTCRHIPSGLYTDLFQYYRSFGTLERLEAQGFEIVPSHEDAVVDRGPML